MDRADELRQWVTVDGVTFSEAAKRLGVSRNVVAGWCARNDVRSIKRPSVAARASEPPSKMREMARAYSLGAKVADLADRFGLKQWQVYHWLRRLRVKTRREKPPKIARHTAAAAVTTPPTGTGVPFMDIGRLQCRNPLWTGVFDVNSSEFCGKPVKPDSSLMFCADCAQTLFRVRTA